MVVQLLGPDPEPAVISVSVWWVMVWLRWALVAHTWLVCSSFLCPPNQLRQISIHPGPAGFFSQREPVPGSRIVGFRSEFRWLNWKWLFCTVALVPCFHRWCCSHHVGLYPGCKWHLSDTTGLLFSLTGPLQWAFHKFIQKSSCLGRMGIKWVPVGVWWCYSLAGLQFQSQEVGTLPWAQPGDLRQSIWISQWKTSSHCPTCFSGCCQAPLRQCQSVVLVIGSSGNRILCVAWWSHELTIITGQEQKPREGCIRAAGDILSPVLSVPGGTSCSVHLGLFTHDNSSSTNYTDYTVCDPPGDTGSSLTLVLGIHSSVCFWLAEHPWGR